VHILHLVVVLLDGAEGAIEKARLSSYAAFPPGAINALRGADFDRFHDGNTRQVIKNHRSETTRRRSRDMARHYRWKSRGVGKLRQLRATLLQGLRVNLRWLKRVAGHSRAASRNAQHPQ
jgi:hypothetical protein